MENVDMGCNRRLRGEYIKCEDSYFSIKVHQAESGPGSGYIIRVREIVFTFD